MRTHHNSATDRRIGKHVRILGGMKEFIGMTGTIVDVEHHGWVKLDDPVEVPRVGRVTDDLWEGRLLKTVRSSK
jgi:hypothetical protein